MSIYFTLLFVALTLEMGTLFFLVLPLPFRLRKSMCTVYDRLYYNQQFRTVGAILGVLVGMLFADSWKRANVHVSTYHDQNSNEMTNDAGSLITPVQVLTSRAYNQRNVYISGFILYFVLCIITVMSIVRRLVKYQSLINESDKNIDDDRLLQELKSKKTSLEGLKSQIANLEKQFDQTNDAKNEPVSELDKKDN
ncbi:hypothetical protein Kpol_262p4 [Vanderwaltozyma polyspora DSM 70294]|uniref:Endoplasmic reticulum transmembrane protein n=1 Tax=Vanderwaltozyma polyspora (strain ATCC 22028 / DSM 70294 / BCRC 21397 / CBS 2163 / NBRC 10782 / NRRL Y-8283 / UCD 57-17) TaxID=436907 RepID=A7TT08_VANPO|nr:uncharacterized protein Kpol_262p4 [Vanderwaltozyma polyspora DSM 70294]EDO14599.1 hypothetical protein Kpol_262p4 [Vanderwaltozyma polyspora DSM 70294]